MIADKRIYNYLELGHNSRGDRVGEALVVPVHRGQTIIVIGRPRSGKGVASKSICLDEERKGRAQGIFDYKGEWKRDMLSPRIDAEDPYWLSDCKVFENFTFKLSDFRIGDWIAAGFDMMQASYLNMLVKDGAWYHLDSVDKFRQMLKDLPIQEKRNAVARFNETYHTTLDGAIPFSTKESLINRFRNLVSAWFWQGPNDERLIIDFATEVLECKNFIVNLHQEGEAQTNEFRARAFAGIILRQLEPIYLVKRFRLWFEEADKIFPNMTSDILPTSIMMGEEIMAKKPKFGVSLGLICQSLSQLHPKLISSGFYCKIIFKLSPDIPFSPELKEISDRLNADLHEACYIDGNAWQHYFYPKLPGCNFESDL